MLKYTFTIPHATQQNVQCEAIGLYRSGIDSNTTEFIIDLINLIDISKVSIIIGDFNICQQKNAHNVIIKTILEKGFKKSVDFPTHIRNGRIDHAYLFIPDTYSSINVVFDLFAPYYTDHYAISVSLNVPECD